MAEDKVKIVGYGERGIVNALVTDLRGLGVDGVKTFLNIIRWPGGSKPEWIEKIETVSLIVELGLGQFGSPDLIFVCQTEGDKYVLFLEAKIVSYATSAMSNSFGMENNFNSSINGQLSLKYRFATTLNTQENPVSSLVESDEIYQAYLEDPSLGGVGDKSSQPRHLNKTSVLRLLSDEGVKGTPLENCYFVALTSDNFASDNSPSPYDDPDTRPLFLGSDGSDLWEQISPRVGWISYLDIKNTEGLKLSEDYGAALATMIEDVRKISVITDEMGNWPWLRTYNIQARFSKKIEELLGRIEDEAREHFGKKSVKRFPGSTSITVLGKVQIKLVPQNPGQEETLWIGVSATLKQPQIAGREDWEGYRIGSGNKKQPFRCLKLTISNPDQAVMEADSVFQQVAEMLDVGDEENE